MRLSVIRALGLAAFAGLALAGAARAEQYVSYVGESSESLVARINQLEAELARYKGGEGGCGCNDACGCCDDCCDDCGCVCANWFDSCCCDPTYSVFVAADAWSDVNDYFDLVGAPNNFGNRVGAEGTWDVNGNGVRAHLGVSYGIYNYHGRFNDASSESQIFITLGAYRRATGCGDDRISWAAAYDYFNGDDYGSLVVGGSRAQHVELSQVRGLVGYMTNPCNEFGLWGAFGIDDDPYVHGRFGAGEIEAQAQVNAYWRRYWDCGGETMIYLGLADPNFESGGANQNSLSEVVIGFRGIAPLTANMGLFGGMHYVLPSTSPRTVPAVNQAAYQEESWNITVGLMWVRGDCCANLPLLPVADNGWFGKRFEN